MDVQIYVDGIRLELFNDEQIVINSSVQNVQDISKVFTDFSQTFTVPASPHNNRIFQHFYENDVNGSLDYNLRITSFIEIDLIPFKTGKIQLEKANLINGAVDSYTVTFYGDLVSLKDILKEDKLSDLDYSAYNHAYVGDEVYDRITDDITDYDLRYPLISSKRVWTYGDATSTDITTNSGSIKFEELLPAIRVRSILTMIENKYNIAFVGSFIDDDRFRKLFLWLKNKEDNFFLTESEPVDIISFTDIFQDSPPLTLFSSVDDVVYSIFSPVPFQIDPDENLVQSNTIKINHSTPNADIKYYIEVYENGLLINTIECINSGQKTVYYDFKTEQLIETEIKEISFKVKSEIAMTVNLTIRANRMISYGLVILQNEQSATCGTILTTSNINIQSTAPNIKITDFLAGIISMFNMVIEPIQDYTIGAILVLRLEPLDSWYNRGAIVDVTDFTDVSDITISTVPLYKKINFEYTESESTLNVKFKDLFNKNYGDLRANFEYDGGELNIKLPFENLLQQKFTNTDLQVGYSLNRELDPYIPKPILLYQYDKTPTTFVLNKGGVTYTAVNDYIPFGQDLRYNGQNVTSNFHPENSSFLLEPIQSTIFSIYYQSYLNNLYDNKQRLVTVKMILPISLLTQLQLNDRLIIRGKRYIINDMKTNLTNGEVMFTLLHDFRPVGLTTIITDELQRCLQIPYVIGNGIISVTFSSTTPGVVITPTTITQDTLIEVCVPDQSCNRITEDSDLRITEDGDNRVIENCDPIPTTIELQAVKTAISGSTTTYTTIIQIP